MDMLSGPPPTRGPAEEGLRAPLRSGNSGASVFRGEAMSCGGARPRVGEVALVRPNTQRVPPALEWAPLSTLSAQGAVLHPV